MDDENTGSTVQHMAAQKADMLREITNLRTQVRVKDHMLNGFKDRLEQIDAWAKTVGIKLPA